jgi:hypothetical protein
LAAFRLCDTLQTVSLSRKTKFEEDCFPRHTELVYRE